MVKTMDFYNKFSNFILMVAMAMLAIVIYLILNPIDILHFDPERNYVQRPRFVIAKTKTKKVKPGDDIVYVLSYTKTRDIKPTIEITLQCDDGLNFNALDIRQGKQTTIGYHKDLEIQDRIPLALFPSKSCEVCRFLVYKPNFFREEHYTICTEKFEIL